MPSGPPKTQKSLAFAKGIALSPPLPTFTTASTRNPEGFHIMPSNYAGLAGASLSQPLVAPKDTATTPAAAPLFEALANDLVHNRERAFEIAYRVKAIANALLGQVPQPSASNGAPMPESPAWVERFTGLTTDVRLAHTLIFDELVRIERAVGV